MIDRVEVAIPSLYWHSFSSGLLTDCSWGSAVDAVILLMISDVASVEAPSLVSRYPVEHFNPTDHLYSMQLLLFPGFRPIHKRIRTNGLELMCLVRVRPPQSGPRVRDHQKMSLLPLPVWTPPPVADSPGPSVLKLLVQHRLTIALQITLPQVPLKSVT